MNTPILETERLILRPVTVADAEEIFTNWTSDPEVAKYVRWSTHPNVEATREWLTFVEQNNSSDTSYDWGFVRKSDNKLIGTGGIYYNEIHECFEIGYNIMRECWHQGYTSEAAKAIVAFAIETLGETTLWGRHAKANPNSGKVMEKVGFHYVQDGLFESFDGTKRGETREYILEIQK
uniref:GNAT family N-acetyltransferase n=1 Tax=Acetatifactor sp. TaxID=1872090 RepID=UPI004056C428